MKKNAYFDLNILDNFIVISESKTLTDAANRIGVSQSAISQSLKHMENVFGVELVVRKTTPITLTPAGLALKEHSNSILSDIRKLKHIVRDVAEKGTPHCRIGAVTSFTEVFGSLFVKNLQQDIELLTLQSGSTPMLNKSFINRELDILISDDPMMEMESVVRFNIFRDPLVLVSKESLLEKASFSIDTLSAQSSMIKYNKQTNIGVLIEVALRRMRLAPEVRFETDDSHTFMSFVKDGHGWGIVTSLCLLQARNQLEGINALELDNNKHSRILYLIARKDELGNLPEKISKIAKELFFNNIYYQLNEICPWLKNENNNC